MKKCAISCCCKLGSDESLASIRFHLHVDNDLKQTLTLLEGLILKELESRLFHLENVYIYTITDVKEFLEEIPTYKNYLSSIEFQLNHAQDVIKIYCKKLLETIENQTKNLISNISPTSVKEIEKMNASHKQLIEKVNKYEEKLLCSFNSQSEEKFNGLFNDNYRLKKSADNFEKTWNYIKKDRQVELGCVQVSELKQAKKFHHEFLKSLNNLICETKYLIFNNMLIVFEKNKLVNNSEDNLVGIVYIKQSIDLSKSNQIDLRQVLYGNDIQWEVFEDGKYIFVCQNPSDFESKLMILFDPIEKKVSKKVELKKSNIESIKRNGTLCAIQCFVNDMGSLVIIDNNLKIVKEKIHDYRLVGADDLHLFLCHDGDKLIKTYDWSLNECKWYEIKFQDTDPSKPFFIERDLLIDEFHKIFSDEFIEYLIHTYSYKETKEQDLKIYKKNGDQLKKLKLSQKGECKLQSCDKIVLLDDKLLKYFDLNGDLFKIVELFGAEIHLFDFKFDKENKIHILDPNALKVYF